MGQKSENQGQPASRCDCLKGMDWLKARMDMLGYPSLEPLAKDLGMNRGNLYRIFTLQNCPGVEVLPVLCRTLYAPVIEILHVLDVVEHGYEFPFGG